MDEERDVRLHLLRSQARTWRFLGGDTISHQAYGDYVVRPRGSYEVREGELLRIDCAGTRRSASCEDGMSEPAEYRPIACGLHDRLEAHATIGDVVTIVARAPDGARLTLEDRLVDVFARGGEEFVRTGRGQLIRLDRLESVDGVTFRRSDEAAQSDGGGR